jgi:hypothetical protein
MPVWLRYGALSTGGGFSSKLVFQCEPFYEGMHEPRWSYRQRAPKTWKDPNRWNSLWSFGCRVNGAGLIAGADGAGVIGQTLAEKDLFEPYSCDGAGCQTKYTIKAQVFESDGTTPVVGATVQAFTTNTETFAGETVTNSLGEYQIMVEQKKDVAHFVVAYKTGSPDKAGTTTNTLLPTNIDGT